MADEPTITLILPTIGRPTLVRALQSLRSQVWMPGDEVLLVGDGHVPTARSLWEQFSLPGRYIEVPGPSRDWGHTPRNLVMPQAGASHLMALDDDDVLVDSAIAIVRRVLAENPDRPHLFRMYGDPCGGLVWRHTVIEHGNVGTPMFVTPADPMKLGQYAIRHGGDCDFIRETSSNYPGGPIWREEVICHVRPRTVRT